MPRMDQHDIIAIDKAIDAAALDAHGWAPLVALLMAQFGGEGGGLNIADIRSGQSIEAINHGLTDAATIDYYHHFFALDPRIPHMARMPVGAAFADSGWYTPGQMDSDPFYAWQSAQGFRHTLFLKLAHDSGQLGAIAITRPNRGGAHDDDALTLAATLAPRLAHAAAVNRRISELEGLNAALASAGTEGARAFAWLDHQGGVRFANQGFRDVLDRRDGLVLNGRHLADPGGRLARALAVVMRGDLVRGLLLPRRGDASPYRIVLKRMSPLAAADRGFQWGRDGGILMFLDDPDIGRSSAVALSLQQMFGLTRNEAAVAMQIGEGKDVEAIAMTMGVAVSTVRTHLKSIFAKLGVSRQIAVALLVRGIPG